MNSLMQPYKEFGTLDKIDIYLLQGIYAKEPDELEITQFVNEVSSPSYFKKSDMSKKSPLRS